MIDTNKYESLLDFITWVKNTHPHYFYKLTTAYEEAKK